MRPSRLISREIRHRKLSFVLGVLSVAVAVACVVGQVTLLAGHDIRTEQLLGDQARITEARLARLTDEYRKLTLKLGFNVRILPKDQDLSDFYASGFAAKTMDEQFTTRLANADIITIRHLWPKLEQKVRWPERDRLILLLGTRGETPSTTRTHRKKPLQTGIAPDRIDVGSHLGLRKGESVTLMGRPFTVRRVLPEAGSRADITVWMDLTVAQELLGMTGRINEIRAVDCRCAWADIDMIREELQRVLPETQVILTRKTALVRAEARIMAATEKAEALAQQRADRDALKARNAAFAQVVSPLIVIACGVWICLLAVANTRARRSEIGILRAVGVRGRRIFGIFVARAMLMGLAGAAIGWIVGFIVAVSLGGLDGRWWASAGRLFSLATLIAAIVGAPLLAAIASWAPTLAAAGQDPASVLCEE